MESRKPGAKGTRGTGTCVSGSLTGQRESLWVYSRCTYTEGTVLVRRDRRACWSDGGEQ